MRRNAASRETPSIEGACWRCSRASGCLGGGAGGSGNLIRCRSALMQVTLTALAPAIDSMLVTAAPTDLAFLFFDVQSMTGSRKRLISGNRWTTDNQQTKK